MTNYHQLRVVAEESRMAHKPSDGKRQCEGGGGGEMGGGGGVEIFDLSDQVYSKKSLVCG